MIQMRVKNLRMPPPAGHRWSPRRLSRRVTPLMQGRIKSPIWAFNMCEVSSPVAVLSRRIARLRRSDESCGKLIPHTDAGNRGLRCYSNRYPGTFYGSAFTVQLVDFIGEPRWDSNHRPSD